MTTYQSDTLDKNKQQKSLHQIQKEHIIWARNQFGDFPAWMTLLGLQEELGELSHSYLKKAEGVRMEEDHDAKMRDAVADILIFLCGFCSTQGIDLQEQLNETWEECYRSTRAKRTI